MLDLSRKKIIIITIATLLLLMIPILIWLTKWQWQVSASYNIVDNFLFFVTETGTAVTYAFITCLVLASFLSLVDHKKQWLMVFFTAFILQVGAQVIKTGLKSFYKEPRPYTSHLVEHHVGLEDFYKESRAERKIIVNNVVESNQTMPTWLKKHWAKETGYSFPSGHTAFAVCWMIVFALVLPMNRKRDWVIFSTVFIWAGLMIVSRIRFGMHYPVDVFVSTIYVPIMCLLYAKITQCQLFSPCFNWLEQLQYRINNILMIKKAC